MLDSSLVITELIAAGSSLADEDGQFNDWIEIQNTGDLSVDMAGYTLTDEDTNGDGSGTPVLKWQFPSAELGPGEYLVVFASGKNRAHSGTQLHTNFQLDMGGEYLALVAPNGTDVVSEFQPAFPTQINGISYGLANEVTVTDRTYAPVGTSAAVHIPTNNNLGTAWTSASYVEGSNGETWTAANTGIGAASPARPR